MIQWHDAVPHTYDLAFTADEVKDFVRAGGAACLVRPFRGGKPAGGVQRWFYWIDGGQ